MRKDFIDRSLVGVGGEDIKKSLVCRLPLCCGSHTKATRHLGQNQISTPSCRCLSSVTKRL